MRFIRLLFFLCTGTAGYAQVLSSGEDVLFAFEVKQIDEFIERFNNEETLIKAHIRSNDPLAVISRTDILKSLINRYDTSWNLNLINEFIFDVNRVETPSFINFLDTEWYAEIACSVRYLNTDQKLTLVLKTEKGNKQSSKWIIVVAEANFLKLPEPADGSVFLNPVSQGTDFLGLDKALSDRKNIRNFLSQDFREDQLSIFLDHWKNGRIVLKQINQIAYHFLQIDGWIFKVENFQRKSRNSGWLISALYKANVAQKKEYKKDVLHFN